MKKNIKVIIFDIDGTLHSEISWIKITNGLGASVNKHQEIFDKYLNREINYAVAKKDLVNLWQATHNANKKYMKSMFESWKLNDDAYSVINYLKPKYKIVLISGSVDLYVKTVAEKLVVDKWYANTKLDWDENENLINLHYFRNQALKKLNQFKHFKKKYSLKNEDCAVVGDGDTDLELFKSIKLSVMIKKDKPHPELEKLASKKINDLGELKKIF